MAILVLDEVVDYERDSMNRLVGISTKGSLIGAGVLLLLAAGPSVFGQKNEGDTAKGKDKFEANCSGCHNADSEETKVGPGLKGLFKRETLHNGKKVTEDNVQALINEGGGGMPSFAGMLTDNEIKDVIAYLKTL